MTDQTTQVASLQAKQKDHSQVGSTSDEQYQQFLKDLQAHFETKLAGNQLFRTSVDGQKLAQAYLEGIADPIERQHYNCLTCLAFIEKYGKLAIIDRDTNQPVTALWDIPNPPDTFAASFAIMSAMVAKSMIESAFVSDGMEFEKKKDAALFERGTLGKPEAGDWHHLSVRLPESEWHRGVTVSANAASALITEKVGMLERRVAEYSMGHVENAVRVLSVEGLTGAIKVIGPARWFLQLHQELAATSDFRVKKGIYWRYAAAAPAGFANIGSTMLGTVLDQLVAGKTYEQLVASFTAKMDPSKYAQPTSAPTEGALKAAEQAFAKLGAGPSLERRFVGISEVQYQWKPEPATAQADAKPDGLFGHLKTKDAEPKIAPIATPTMDVTWHKFVNSVLPTCTEMEIRFIGHVQYPIVTLTGAVHPDAPPIIQWDFESQRNPVSYYTLAEGRQCAEVNLAGGVYHKVVGICESPAFWYDNVPPNFPEMSVVLIEGAKELADDKGVALFPEILKSEFHPYSVVVQAFSQSAKLGEINEPQAIGLAYTKGHVYRPAEIRVKRDDVPGHSVYRITQWD